MNIANCAFYCLRDLVSITIPNSVKNIGDGAFAGCIILETINYTGTEAQWNAITKGVSWNEYCPEITVHCTDGDIVIPASV